ncbi:hypothetical protein PIB30_112917, partial [Stylosanthes scabra]|nr:hypothetical protein [Stylosanthes scabra]
MVEETPTRKQEVKAKKETTTIPTPRPKPSRGKPKPLSKFLEIFACLEVNIPLLKDLREMSAYVHSMKELLLKKITLNKGDKVVMTKECGSLIQAD